MFFLISIEHYRFSVHTNFTMPGSGKASYSIQPDWNAFWMVSDVTIYACYKWHKYAFNSKNTWLKLQLTLHFSSKVTFSFKQTLLIYKLVDSRFSSVAVVLDVDVGNFRSVRVDDLGHERGVPRFAVVHGETGRHAHLGLLQTVPVQFDLWNVVVWLDFGC